MDSLRVANTFISFFRGIITWEEMERILGVGVVDDLYGYAAFLAVNSAIRGVDWVGVLGHLAEYRQVQQPESVLSEKERMLRFFMGK